MATLLAPVSAAVAQQATVKPATQQSAASSGNSVGTASDSVQVLDSFIGQKVSSVELVGRPDLNDEQLLPLLALHAGEPFDRTRIEQSIAAIKSTGKFEDVQLSVIPDLQGVRVMLILQPAMYFGIYEFPGSSREFPYSRLLQIANYPPEGPFNRRDIATASESRTKFFQQNG